MAELQPSRLPRAPRPATGLRTVASMSQLAATGPQGRDGPAGSTKQMEPKRAPISGGQMQHQSSSRNLRGQALAASAVPSSSAAGTAKRPLRSQPSNGDLRQRSIAPPSQTTMLRPRQSSANLLLGAKTVRGPPTERSMSAAQPTPSTRTSQAPLNGVKAAGLQPERAVRRIASAAVLSSSARVPSPMHHQQTGNAKTVTGPPATAAGPKRSLSAAITRQSSVLGLRSAATAAQTASTVSSPLIGIAIPESPVQSLVPPRRAVSHAIRPSPLSREAVPLAGSPFGDPAVRRTVSTQKLRSGPLVTLKATPASQASRQAHDKAGVSPAKQVSFQPSPRVPSQPIAPGSRLRTQQPPLRTSPSNDAGLSTPAPARTPAMNRANRTVPDTPALPQLLAAASRAHLLESSQRGMIKDAELSFSSDLSDSTSPASPLKPIHTTLVTAGMEKQLAQLRRERDAAVERAVRAERQVAELSRQAKVVSASKLWAEVERGAKSELVEAEAWLRVIKLQKAGLAARQGAAPDAQIAL